MTCPPLRPDSLAAEATMGPSLRRYFGSGPACGALSRDNPIGLILTQTFERTLGGIAEAATATNGKGNNIAG